MSPNDVYIVSAARTPIGAFCGSLSTLKASDLGSIVIKEVLKRANVDTKDVSEVILGQSLTAGQGQNPARQASMSAGLPVDIPAFQINMLCGSGLKSVMLGYQSILCGQSNIVISGGQESMSQSHHSMHMRSGFKMGDACLVDTMLKDGLTDAFNNEHMGKTAENIAVEYNINRQDQDTQAEKSQNLAEIAQKEGYFNSEIVPVTVPNRKGDILVEVDEYPKHGTTLEALSKLRPCFNKENGTVTAGNASGINDGAAAVLLMSSEEINKRNIKPLAKIIAFAENGCEPNVMGIGPVGAVKKVLSKAQWNIEEVDLFELNEAFAAQALAVNRQLNINASKVNIHGGAIALGHPIGASGARVLVTLLYALKRTGGKKGIASLCIGGGMGIAIAIETC
uniref:Putative 3-oxoacyl coa thiolase n=1 Tax=Xenopsylla cheopis TaxID=163159 RepID=A0A6M2DIR2_XENCH